MDLKPLTSFLDQFRSNDSQVKSSICAIGARAVNQFKKNLVEDVIVDDEYDNIKLRFNATERNMRDMEKSITSYCENLEELFLTSKNICESATALFDPYHSLSKATLGKLNDQRSIEKASIFLSQSKCRQFGYGYSLWRRAHKFADACGKLQKQNQREISFIQSIVSVKTAEALAYIKVTKKTMNHRQSLLTQYSKITFELNDLKKKQKENQLSLKQSQRLFNLERKADTLLSDYENVNMKLKDIGPELLKLNDEQASILQQLVYYVQFTVFYQVDLQLSTLQDLINADSCTDPESAIKALTTEIDGFKSINHHSLSKNSNADAKVHQNGTCVSLYDFTAQHPGDLTLKKGDRIRILSRESQWWKGELNGKIGAFPYNYVKVESKN